MSSTALFTDFALPEGSTANLRNTMYPVTFLICSLRAVSNDGLANVERQCLLSRIGSDRTRFPRIAVAINFLASNAKNNFSLCLLVCLANESSL
jgi:hypothetical protein